MSFHKTVLGAGPDLVLVHGWAMSAAAFGDWPRRLAERWRVTLIDLPGHGESRDLPWAGDVAEQLAATASRGAVWAGWSLGGLLSLRAAPAAEATALLLMGASPRFCAGDGWPHGVDPTRIAAMQAGLATEPARVLREFHALLATGDARALVRQIQAATGGEPMALKEGLRALAESDLRDEIGALTMPACWLVGETDPLVPAAAAIWAATAMPRGQSRVVAGAGHLPFLAAPAAVEAALLDLRGSK